MCAASASIPYFVPIISNGTRLSATIHGSMEQQGRPGEEERDEE